MLYENIYFRIFGPKFRAVQTIMFNMLFLWAKISKSQKRQKNSKPIPELNANFMLYENISFRIFGRKFTAVQRIMFMG